MKKVIIFFFFFHLLHAAEKSEQCLPPANNQRDLVILNDPTGIEVVTAESAMTGVAHVFLVSQAGPLLIQTSIWQNLIKVLDGKYSFYKEHIKDFDLFDLDKSFVLVIPHSYKKRLNIDQNEQLGFDFLRLKKIENPLNYQPFNEYLQPFYEHLTHLRNISADKSVVPDFFAYTIGKSMTLSKALQKIITPNEYSWNILMFGHGSSASDAAKIAGLSHQEFRKILIFLNEKIHTNLLSYTTCFGGSKCSLIDAYLVDGKPLLLNYPIIISALGDAVTAMSFRNIIDRFMKSPQDAKIKAQYDNFISERQNFFSNLHKFTICPLNINKITLLMDTIYDFSLMKYGVDLIELNNLLQIRWPGNSFFKPMPIADKVAVISQKVHIKSIFGPKILERILLIDEPFNDSPIFLGTKIEHIETSMPDQQWYYIRSLIMPGEIDLRSIPSFFGGKTYIPGEFIHKMEFFLIDTISYDMLNESIQKVVINLYGNSFIDPTKEIKREMLFTRDDKAYVLTEDDEEILLDNELTQKYSELFEAKKSELENEFSVKKPTKGLFSTFYKIMQKRKKKEAEKPTEQEEPRIIHRPRVYQPQIKFKKEAVEIE